MGSIQSRLENPQIANSSVKNYVMMSQFQNCYVGTLRDLMDRTTTSALGGLVLLLVLFGGLATHQQTRSFHDNEQIRSVQNALAARMDATEAKAASLEADLKALNAKRSTSVAPSYSSSALRLMLRVPLRLMLRVPLPAGGSSDQPKQLNAVGSSDQPKQLNAVGSSDQPKELNAVGSPDQPKQLNAVGSSDRASNAPTAAVAKAVAVAKGSTLVEPVASRAQPVQPPQRSDLCTELLGVSEDHYRVQELLTRVQMPSASEENALPTGQATRNRTMCSTRALDKPKKIVDAFLFGGGEVDTLEIRLFELYPVVDQFLIVISSVTHKGERAFNPIPHLFESERFRVYQDKVEVLEHQQALSNPDVDAIRFSFEVEKEKVVREYVKRYDDQTASVAKIANGNRVQGLCQPNGEHEGRHGQGWPHWV